MQTTYNTQALSDIFKKYRVVRSNVAALFHQSNNQTIDGWLAGKDIYLSRLLGICNHYQMDLLSFIRLGDHTFQTTLQDLRRFERAGLSLTDIMRQHGVEPVSDRLYRSLSPVAETSSSTCPAKPGDLDTPADDPEPATAPAPPVPQASAPAPAPAAEGTAPTAATLTPDILDRFVAMQTSAFSHEQQALQRQRQDLQAIIDMQQKTIDMQQRTIERLQRAAGGTQRRVTPYGMVADDTTLQYDAKDK